jgi:hypothetical protein
MAIVSSSGINFRRFFLALIALIVLFGGIGLLWSILRTFDRPSLNVLQIVATFVAVPVLLLGFHYHNRLSRRWQILWGILVLAIIVVFGFANASVMYGNIVDPPVWDFLTFWLNGQVAVRGLDFYEPASYQDISLPISPGDAFTSEILEVGFWYPPPSMFIFLPLGFFDIKTAMIMWYIAHLIVLALDIVLLWKIFLGRTGLLGIVFVLGLVVVLGSTLSTLRFGQTSFLALLMLLLFWRDREYKYGGMWLIFGAFVKPFLLLIFIHSILRRQWRVLLSAASTLIVISMLTIGIFGTEVFYSYFENNPTARLPSFVYTEMVNQSLLATILRITNYTFNGRSPLTHPLYIVLTLILTGITCSITFSLKADQKGWTLALLLLLSLVIYPSSGVLYSFLLIIPILLLWVNREEIPIGVFGIVAFITVVYVLISHNSYVFVANALLWLALAIFLIWTIYQRRYHAERLHLNA